jgi:ribosome-binding ATPase
VDTLQIQFSGYGSTSQVVARTLERAKIKTPLETWSDETVEQIVTAFTDEKFPTVIALNKIDHPDADKVSPSRKDHQSNMRLRKSLQNIAKIAKSHPAESLVLTSAVSELFLRKLAKQGYVRYAEGTDAVDTRADLVADGDPDGGGLKPMDDKLAGRLEKLRDLVLFRFASTGVAEVLRRAAALLGLVPVFPVRSVQGLGVPAGAAAAAGGTEKKVFRDCVLVKRCVGRIPSKRG